MYLDIYAIQNVPPCDINRDDTGTPKTAIYGGYLRSRVSSQAWKHAMREEFAHTLDPEGLGVRTKHAVGLIADEIKSQRPDLADEAEGLASAVLQVTGVKIEKSKRTGSEEGSAVSQYLIFIARSEVAKLARIAIDAHEAGEDISKPTKELKKKVSAAFHGTQALDIALFGRMLADAPDLNTDASSQVAHAISVDKVTQEYDYFTAVDDCAADDNAGAAMLDTIGFNSSTLYRYATVCLDSLSGQLGDAKATAEGARSFLSAFVRSMPTGKQNTFANRTLPSYVLISLRGEQPINAVSAFEEPIHPSAGKSVSRIAAEKLGARVASLEEGYGMKASQAWYVSVDGPVDELESIAQKSTLGDAAAGVRAAVVAACGDGE